MAESGTDRALGRWRGWVAGLLCIQATACAAPPVAGGGEAAARVHMVERQLAGVHLLQHVDGIGQGTE